MYTFPIHIGYVFLPEKLYSVGTLCLHCLNDRNNDRTQIRSHYRYLNCGKIAYSRDNYFELEYKIYEIETGNRVVANQVISNAFKLLLRVSHRKKIRLKSRLYDLIYKKIIIFLLMRLSSPVI